MAQKEINYHNFKREDLDLVLENMQEVDELRKNPQWEFYRSAYEQEGIVRIARKQLLKKIDEESKE